jgi:hypothetical protein
MSKQPRTISINKAVLGKYTDAQLTQWAQDNALTEAEFISVRFELGRQDAEEVTAKRKRAKKILAEDRPNAEG